MRKKLSFLILSLPLLSTSSIAAGKLRRGMLLRSLAAASLALLLLLSSGSLALAQEDVPGTKKRRKEGRSTSGGATDCWLSLSPTEGLQAAGAGIVSGCRLLSPVL